MRMPKNPERGRKGGRVSTRNSGSQNLEDQDLASQGLDSQGHSIQNPHGPGRIFLSIPDFPQQAHQEAPQDDPQKDPQAGFRLCNTPRKKPWLIMDGVSKSYAGKEVIKNASLRLEGGRALALTGPSGIGKSTLLEIMAGVVKPDSGIVTMSCRPSLMFQDDALVPWLTAEDNIVMAAISSVEYKICRQAAALWLDYFELPKDATPPELSGGMRRRLNFARTLTAMRQVVLLDEPFAFLDKRWRLKVALQIASLVANGDAVALTHHGDIGVLDKFLGGALSTVELESSPIELNLI